jgi:DNA topoisomerase-3
LLIVLLYPDHPPITPCRNARAGELSGDMARVYDLVTRHFIASVSHDAVWTSTTVHLEIDVLDDKGQFTIRGKQVRFVHKCSIE